MIGLKLDSCVNSVCLSNFLLSRFTMGLINKGDMVCFSPVTMKRMHGLVS